MSTYLLTFENDVEKGRGMRTPTQDCSASLHWCNKYVRPGFFPKLMFGMMNVQNNVYIIYDEKRWKIRE